MFFQDIEKMKCKGKPKTDATCEKCWGCKIVERKRRKKCSTKSGSEKRNKNKGMEERSLNKSTREEKSLSRTIKKKGRLRRKVRHHDNI
jgi:hypothetical protein